jgi:GNAT superfamily N-acetyltransferase
VQTRRAGAEEVGEITELWLRSRAASRPHIPSPVHTEKEVRAWFEETVMTNCDVWVADAGDAIVGLLVLDDEWLEQLYVEPALTGQGIGGELMAVAKRERPHALKLWTFETNHGARRFYERHGFVATGVTDGDNEEGAPDLRYEWSPAGVTATSYPDDHDEIRRLRPDGPLAVSHRTGHRKDSPGTDRRFDSIWTSSHFDILSIDCPYDASCRAGSDHSAVVVDIARRPAW